MGALLSKDADGGLAHMSENIRFLRLRQTVTKAELKTTLQGYFEKPGFGESPLADVLDMDSVFVQPTVQPRGGRDGNGIRAEREGESRHVIQHPVLVDLPEVLLRPGGRELVDFRDPLILEIRRGLAAALFLGLCAAAAAAEAPVTRWAASPTWKEP